MRQYPEYMELDAEEKTVMFDAKYMYKNHYTEDFLQFSSIGYRRDEKLNIKCIEQG